MSMCRLLPLPCFAFWLGLSCSLATSVALAQTDPAQAEAPIDVEAPDAGPSPEAPTGPEPTPVTPSVPQEPAAAPAPDQAESSPTPAPDTNTPDALPPPAEGELLPDPALPAPLPEEAAVPVELPPEAPVPVDPIEVTVVGTRVAKTAGSAHVIREKQLARFEYDDAHSILLQVPGVYIRQEDGVGLRPNIGLRGANPDRSKKVTLMEDGILFGPSPYSAPAAYYFPLMTRMAGVRVIKGPSAVAYGPQTVGGAIDFITSKVPTRTMGLLDMGVGEYGYAKTHARLGAGTEQLGFLVEGVHLQNSGFMELPSGNNTGSKRNDWMVKTAYVLDPDARTRHEFGLKLSYADETSNESYLGLTDADFRADPYRRYPAAALDKMVNHRTSAVWSHVLTAPHLDLEVKTHLYRHDYDRSWRKLNRFRGGQISPILRDPAGTENAAYYPVLTGEVDSASPGSDTLLIGPNDRQHVSQGLQTVANLGATTGPLAHRIEGGARLHYDSIDRRHTEDAFLMVAGKLVSDGTPTEVTTSNTAASYALATHLTDAITYKKLTVTPGIRVELIASETTDRRDNNKKADGFVVAAMPGVGAYYAFVEELGVLAGVHRGFSPPPPAAGKDVKPEYSVNYEAGARYTSGRSRAEAIGFFNDYQNLTDVCTFSSGCVNEALGQQFDAGEARIYGLELYAEHELSIGPVKFPMSAAYTFSRGEFLRSFQSQDPIYGEVEKGDGMPYLPRHQTTATLAVESSRAGGGVSLNYVAKMREEPGSERLADAWATDDQLWVDLEAHVRAIGPLVLYGNVRNLFDSQNIVSRRPYGARVNAPRWIQVGAKVAF